MPHNTPKEQTWIDYINQRHGNEDVHVTARLVPRAIGDEVLPPVSPDGDGNVAHALAAPAADLALAGSGATQAAVPEVQHQPAAGGMPSGSGCPSPTGPPPPVKWERETHQECWDPKGYRAAQERDSEMADNVPSGHGQGGTSSSRGGDWWSRAGDWWSSDSSAARGSGDWWG